MKSYDSYLSRDLNTVLNSEQLTDLSDCELIVHGGLLQEQYIQILQKKEDERTQIRGKCRTITEKDAKNEAKNKQAMKIKNSLTNYTDLAVTHNFLPPTKYSVAMTFSWTLKTPFFSRAIDEFGSIDNPVTRDTLSNMPLLHASGAKGMLRNALTGDISDADILELFGNDCEIKDQDAALAGCIVPGDVIFSHKTKTEIFSPHVRKTKTADHPVSSEVVPAGALATWELLLFDFRNKKEQMKPHLLTILKAVDFLVTELGMSAKRTSGLGVGTGLNVMMRSGGAFQLPTAQLPIAEAIKHVEAMQ